MTRLISSALLAISLVGCGVEVASTAATEAALRAQEAKQAQQLQDRVRSELDAAMKTEANRRRQADEAANF